MKIWAAVFCLALAAPASILYLFENSANAVERANAESSIPSLMRFEIDASRSKFMVKARRGGLAWFKGHSHYIAVRDFSGRAEVTLDALNPASLEMTINAASLEETGANFTPQQKAIINKEMKEIVLETAKYPVITFRSTDVKGGMKNGKFALQIGGDIMLHGVTKHVTIPATVSVEGDTMRAVGEFELDRSDFNVKATSAFHGLVRIKNSLKFTFDIVGRRI